MITIQQSQTADTRTCDYANVTKDTLLASSRQHIGDVREALRFFSDHLKLAAQNHDTDKINEDGFVSISVADKKYDRLRLPLFSCHPKFATDLERLADAIAPILRTMAAELRAAGREDLRSESDKRMDEFNAERNRMLAKLRSPAPRGDVPPALQESQ